MHILSFYTPFRPYQLHYITAAERWPATFAFLLVRYLGTFTAAVSPLVVDSLVVRHLLFNALTNALANW